MAEDLLAVSLVAAAAGSGTVARPLADRGIDLYFRRLRSLLTVPIQVKAFRLLNSDGVGSLPLPVSEVPSKGNGYLALVHLPEPYDQLYRRVFMVPFTELIRRCPRKPVDGVESFVVTVDFADLQRNPLADLAVDLDSLGDWVESIPGWSRSGSAIHQPAFDALETRLPGESEWEAAIGQLWMASQLERAGHLKIVVAEDRVRLDTVTLLVHDLETGEIAALHIRTQRISKEGRVHFEVKRPTFFIDANLYVLLLLFLEDWTPADFSLLIPSDAIPTVGYSETITFRRLTKKFQPYQVPTGDAAAAFLKAALSRS
jgi:hypothetical protein